MPKKQHSKGKTLKEENNIHSTEGVTQVLFLDFILNAHSSGTVNVAQNARPTSSQCLFKNSPISTANRVAFESNLT